jgi:diguanylate cyclase (GGDEF)-like protein/PAS domain S-box-containing protein
VERLSEIDHPVDWFSSAARLGDGLFIMDKHGVVVSANEEFARIIGVKDTQACLGHKPLELLIIDQVADVPECLANDITANPVVRDAVLRIRTLQGQVKWILYNHVEDTAKEDIRYLASVHDMTAFCAQQEKTRENEILFRSLFTYSPHAITLIRPDGVIVLDNDKARALYTYNKRYYVESRNIFEFVDKDARQKTQEFLEEMKAGNEVINTETILYRRDGSSFWAEVSAKYIHGTEGQEDYIIIFSEDISERKNMAEQIRNLSITDELTGLYNRRGFTAAANQEITRASQDGYHLALLFMDMDHMKQINDTQGHLVGDQALKSLASVLQMNFRDSSITGRWGGDEFVVLAVDEPVGSIEKLLENFSRDIHTLNSTKARPFELSVTFGMAQYNPTKPIELEHLVMIADGEMYHKKRNRAASTP